MSKLVKNPTNYGCPTCTCGYKLRLIERFIDFHGQRSKYDQGISDYYYHCDKCKSDFVLTTLKRIIIKNE